MPRFNTTQQAEEVFGELFTILINDEEFLKQVKTTGLTFRLVHTKPECTIYVSEDGVRAGDDAPDTALITIKMSTDIAHALWMGTLLMPTALATGKVRIKGKVSQVLQLVPILKPAFDRYPSIAAEHGITDASITN